MHGSIDNETRLSIVDPNHLGGAALIALGGGQQGMVHGLGEITLGGNEINELMIMMTDEGITEKVPLLISRVSL